MGNRPPSGEGPDAHVGPAGDVGAGAAPADAEGGGVSLSSAQLRSLVQNGLRRDVALVPYQMPRMLELNPQQSHVVHGNRMREQSDKNRTIRYDNRWFYRSEWLWPYLLSPRTRRLNKRLVYHNETGRLWNQ